MLKILRGHVSHFRQTDSRRATYKIQAVIEEGNLTVQLELVEQKEEPRLMSVLQQKTSANGLRKVVENSS